MGNYAQVGRETENERQEKDNYFGWSTCKGLETISLSQRTSLMKIVQDGAMTKRQNGVGETH